MDLASFSALLSPQGHAALQSAQALQPREVDYLSHFQSLCRQYPAALTRAALETAILRQEAIAKFPPHIAQCLYLNRQAFEQATSFEISCYRAERYSTQGSLACILDLGCSIGGDTLALAGVSPVIGVDLDELRLHMARANLAALVALPASPIRYPADFVQADLTHSLPFARRGSIGLFFDPARRTAGGRVFSVEEYHPPLSAIKDWLEHYPMLGVKLSPGVNLAEVHNYPAEVEFISLSGELKECVLWFGPLRRVARRATLLPSRAQLSADDLLSITAIHPRLNQPQEYLYEPDPAVLRAGLVRHLAEQINATQLDPDIAYLTSQTAINTPFARRWEIEAWFPFQLKRLRTFLRQHQIGRVTVKKRGSPLEPQALVRELRLQGSAERIVVLTHYRGEPIVIICLPTPPPAVK